MSSRIISTLLTLCLTLSLMAGSVMAGIAQGQPERAMGALTRMVICDSAGGTSVIAVDESGNRVDPEPPCDALHCSNCLGTVAFDLPPVSPGFSAASNAQRVRVAMRHVQFRTHTGFFKPARGPPVEV